MLITLSNAMQKRLYRRLKQAMVCYGIAIVPNKRSIIKILNFIDAKTFVVYIAIGCSRWDWFKCAQAVHSARCSSECMEGLTSQACISHLGSSYDQCTNCFALAETIKKSGEYHAVYNMQSRS